MKKNEGNFEQEESKFMQLWHNKRTHAAMVLGLWMIFLLFVMVICFVGGEATKNEKINNINDQVPEKKDFKDYKEMQADLLKNNYKYEYELISGDIKVKYNGEKFNQTETGYKENSESTIKYYIDETGFYSVLMDELHSFDKLYENVIESYIDLEYIFTEINNQSVISEEVDETRTFTYKYQVEGIDYQVVVTTSLDAITNVEVKFEDKYYKLKYTNINELTTLSFIPQAVN